MRPAVVVLVVMGCGGAGTQLPRSQVTDPGQALFNGHTKPEIDCYKCHGGFGRGAGRGPDLATRVPKLDDAALRAVILDGKGKMPAWRGKLSDEELTQITTWLRSRFPGA